MKISTISLVAGSAFFIVSIIGVFLYLNVASNQSAQAGTTDPESSTPRPKVAQALTVSLQTTNGTVLMQQQAIASDKTVDVNLPQALPAGLYLMKVKGEKGIQSQSISIKLAPSK